MVGIQQAIAARRFMESAIMGQPEERGWNRAVFTELSIAEDLLDRLERSAQVGQKLCTIDDTTFEVRWH